MRSLSWVLSWVAMARPRGNWRSWWPPQDETEKFAVCSSRPVRLSCASAQQIDRDLFAVVAYRDAHCIAGADAERLAEAIDHVGPGGAAGCRRRAVLVSRRVVEIEPQPLRDAHAQAGFGHRDRELDARFGKHP